MSNKSSAPKTTTLVNGVPHTTTTAKANAAAAPSTTASAGAVPARGQAGWIDPIRAPGDTKFTDKYGTPTAEELNNANAPTTAPMGPPTDTTTAPQAPNLPQAGTDPLQAATKAQGAVTAPTAPVSTPTAAPTPTQTKYQAGFQAAQASGITPPVDAGAARTATTALMPAQQPDTGPTDALIAGDPGMNQIFTNINNLLNSQNQTSSLMDDYKKLYKQSGLSDINQELIDADTVINGTEDDIRNEIQTAGGFGTESQVQAMTLSRNKNLLKRYNQLVQMKTDATNQLNTMVQLNQQDKQMAQEKVNTQISTMFNMANFRQTALNNTRQQQQFLLQQDPVGYYNSLSKDPRQLAISESIMGVGPGGIQQIAQHAQEQQNFARSVQEQQLAISQGNLNLERQKYQDSLRATKPQTQAQAVAQGYADNAKEANKIISQLGNKFASPTALGGLKIPLLGIGLPNALKSSDRQQYEQAQRDFVNAVLRPESGAAISQSEYDSAAKQYFPSAGDSTATVAQKAANRQTKLNALYNQANAIQPVGAGEMVQGPDGKSYLVGADGNSLTPI
jgi:hypothetical protein